MQKKQQKQEQQIVEEQSAQTDGIVMTEEEVRRYLEERIMEWNHRLLTDMELLDDKVLWVESVTVTGYRLPPERQTAEKPKFRGLFWIFRHLMGKWRSHKK